MVLSIKFKNCLEFITFFFCASTIMSLIDTNINGLPSNIEVTTTPVVFFGNSLSEMSSLLRSLTKIFKFSILVYFYLSSSFLLSALNSLEDSNLPSKTFFEINL